MLQLILDRLKTGNFPSVEVAEEINAIVGRAPALCDGAIVLVPMRERGGPQRDATAVHLQTVQMQFAVATLFREYGDPKGASRAMRWDASREAVEDVLVGWCPSEGADPCAFVSADASPLGNGVSLYVQIFQTSRQIRKAIT
jgi:hypothetical protein